MKSDRSLVYCTLYVWESLGLEDGYELVSELVIAALLPKPVQL